MATSADPFLAHRIDAVLPQTQCRQCGHDGCRPYAEAIAAGDAINRCPPGGDAVIAALARVTGRPQVPLDRTHGEHTALAVARIDEAWCIGCTLCIDACPVDAIIGAPKRMHAILPSLCTGCALCLPPCPVDCILMIPAGRAWSAEDARAARARFDARNRRSRARIAPHDNADSHRASGGRFDAPRLEGRRHRRGARARPCAPCGILGPQAMNPQKRRAIFERLRAANPQPKPELEHRTPFELLVAVVLSAQATDKGVNKATAQLFPVANTPAAIAQLGVDGLIPYVQSIGLFRTKAKNIVALSRLLLAEHGGEVPADREALERLPGVGRKTANVVLNVAFGQPTIAVDTHIFRVANRTGLGPGRTPEEVEQKLLRFVPEEFRQHAHHWLILHGRYVCVARTPKCGECLIRDLCEFRQKTA